MDSEKTARAGSDYARTANPANPSVNLPKGGGAIRGIGEKFAANPVTGTGSLTVPIATSPGRSGFGPQLSLTYDSATGNGPFGLGWNLSLPAITRKTDKGLPRYHDSHPATPATYDDPYDSHDFHDFHDFQDSHELHDLQYLQDLHDLHDLHDPWVSPDRQEPLALRERGRGEGAAIYAEPAPGAEPAPSAEPAVGAGPAAPDSDVFILSGFEDLVPVLDDDGQLSEDKTSTPGYTIRRYRPRIEGLFGRIERWSRCDGEVHWRSISSDNVLTLYGFDPDSRIADPENPARVFSWLICRSYDDKGNAMLYDYAAENDAGVDTAKPSERGRIRSANRYLKRIRYGNRVPLLFDPERASLRLCHLEPHDLDGAGWMFEAVFDYGEDHYLEEAPDQEGRFLARAEIFAGRNWQVRSDPFSTYRSAFEIRSYRLCRRVLMFHHFPQELSREPFLVRSTAFLYQEKPLGSFITQVVQSGHRLLEDGRYLTRSLPALELSYTASPLEDPDFVDFRLQEVDRASLANLPGGVDEESYRFIDLDGEGISGVLTEQDDAWFYKPNLGNARFGATETVQALPSLAALGGATPMLMDLAGDGNLDLVELSASLSGFQERTVEAGWEGFRAFGSLPVRDWGDPNLRFVDLTGDGIADLLASGDDAFIWHPSLLREGFGPGLLVRMPEQEAKGPRVLFADADQSIYLADMTGDGLSDILRIRNGEICYWPNLGYGRFGAKITMDHAPRLDQQDLFDQGRIRLADIDGSGTSDLIYLGQEGVSIFLNLSGNGWSQARELRGFPALDDLSSISVTDLLGRGTACLVWSSPLPREAGRQLQYVDLMCGVKPHLLKGAVNNLGAETRIEYASSTEFYLDDKAAGTPWLTRLPFPVQVVKRVETYDYVSRNRFVSVYSYHHGFYDGVEREFRGFGRVDQLDTEQFAALTASGNFPVGNNIAAASNVPPVLTRTWFHTGVYPRGEQVSRHLAHEYYQEGAVSAGEAQLSPEQLQAMLLDDTILPEGLTPEEAREACRSLKGSLLRQEIYALDENEASRRPYSVMECNYSIRTLQTREGARPARGPTPRPGQNNLSGPINLHAVFFTHARETLSFNYERRLYLIDGCRRADPRVAHQAVLEVDDYGNLLKSVSIGYGRRFADPSPLLKPEDREKQARIQLTLMENRYTNAVLEPHAYRVPLHAEARLYEMVNIKPYRQLPGITNLLRFTELAQAAARAGDGRHELPFEDWQARGATGSAPFRRLIKQSRILYRSNALDRLLPLGRLESLALMGENYQLALTPDLLASNYWRSSAGEPPEALLPDPAEVLGSQGPDGGGYRELDADGRWWTASGRVFFHADPEADPAAERAEAHRHFFLPRRMQDPFGYSSTLDFDAHDLMTVRTVDAQGNTELIESDYRVLQARLVTDPNGNRMEALFDTLGLVAASAVKGKLGEQLGDLLDDIDPDPPPLTLLAFVEDPIGQAASLLGHATSRTLYDLERFRRTGEPSFAAHLARETHFFDSGAAPSKIQLGVSYSDGFGREIQLKIQAEPGPLQPGGAPVDPRWVATGWTIFNNKGKPVRQYEPFFDDTHAYRFGVTAGVSPVLFYDPLERVIATLHPDHSYQKVVFDPWVQTSYDVNDTVTLEPGNDPQVRGFFTRLPERDYLPTWYALRTDLFYLAEMESSWPDPRDREAQRKAAQKAALHADTPGIAFFDSLGRSFLTVAQNRFQRHKPDDASETIEENYLTRIELDIEANQREVVDAKERVVMRYDFDLLGNRIRQASMEAGERWMLDDVLGSPIRTWDSRGHRFRSAYDPLRRPSDFYLREGGGTEVTIGRTVYGESRPDPEVHNLRGREVQVFDQTGVVSRDQYDFKGNLISSGRQLAVEYKATLDWSGGVALEAERYLNRTRYDALNRPIELETPHTPDMEPSVIRPGYNEANLLERVEANLQGVLLATTFIGKIEYDAKGQRTRIDYGNGVSTSFAYDPLTFRLVQLITRRSAAAFPGDCPQPAPAGWPGCQVQNLHYCFDPVGNITQIRDDAQQVLFFRNKRVEPSSDYSYDAVYRLIEATGREHLGQGGASVASSYNDKPRVGILFSASDGQAMGRYLQRYLYDAVGNFEATVHRGADPARPGWTRTCAYREPSQLEAGKKSNRLTSSTVHPRGAQPTLEPYGYDAHGNTQHMPHLSLMQWDFNDQLQMTQRQAVNSEDADGVRHQGERSYYRHDEEGERVRKVTELATGQLKDERIYLGGFEIYKKHGSSELVRETLHVMDEQQTLALVETRTRGSDDSPAQLIRYQFGNHLGSASLELDGQAQVISYEEYYPYGSTSYQAVRSQTETPKRYRYAGMERDEENGLNCHGVRYYATWLGRWISADPSGLSAGLQLYGYASNSPVVFLDTTGRDPKGGLTFKIDPRFQKKWGKTQTLVLPRPKSKAGSQGGGRTMRGSDGGEKGGVAGGEEGGVVGGKVGGKGIDVRTQKGPPGTGAGGTNPPPPGGGGTGTGPGGTGKDDGGGSGGDGKGKGKTPGGQPGGVPGGKPGGKPGGSKDTPKDAPKDAPKDDKPGKNPGEDTLLGDLAALAAMIDNPESLYNAQQTGNTGKGAQMGRKNGLIKGWLGQLLSVVVVLGSRLWRAAKAVGGWVKKGFSSLKNKLLGTVERKALGEGLDQAGLVKLFGQGPDDAEALLERLQAGEVIPLPNNVTSQMLRDYKAAAEANLETIKDMTNLMNKDDAIATQALRIQSIDILLSQQKK